MPANYPAAVYAPRTKTNKVGVVYDPNESSVGYAEDVSKLDAEVVAIETELGANPKGDAASVVARLNAADDFNGKAESAERYNNTDEIEFEANASYIRIPVSPSSYCLELAPAHYPKPMTITHVRVILSDALAADTQIAFTVQKDGVDQHAPIVFTPTSGQTLDLDVNFEFTGVEALRYKYLTTGEETYQLLQTEVILTGLNSGPVDWLPFLDGEIDALKANTCVLYPLPSGSISNNNVLATLAGFAPVLKSGRKYLLELFLKFSIPSAADVQWQLYFPQNPSYSATRKGDTPTTVALARNSTQQILVDATGYYTDRLTVFISDLQADNTISFKWAQVTSNASPIQLYPNSVLRVTDLGAG
jgi:hypothetical protein